MNTRITSVALLVEVTQPLQSGAYSTDMFLNKWNSNSDSPQQICEKSLDRLIIIPAERESNIFSRSLFPEIGAFSPVFPLNMTF